MSKILRILISGGVIALIVIALFVGRSSGITKEQATARVEALPEVIEYKAMLVKAGAKSTIEAEDGEGAWSVQVFEIVKNSDGSSHTATFGWYSVDKKTGTVEKNL